MTPKKNAHRTGAAEAGSARPTRDRRLRRIAAYRAKSLQEADKLRGILGAVNSDLMSVEFWMATILKRELAATAATGTAGDLVKLRPDLEMLGTLTRRIQGFANLDVRLQAERRRQESPPLLGPPARPERPLAADQSLLQEAQTPLETPLQTPGAEKAPEEPHG